MTTLTYAYPNSFEVEDIMFDHLEQKDRPRFLEKFYQDDTPEHPEVDYACHLIRTIGDARNFVLNNLDEESVHECNDKIFREACAYGRLDFARWFHSTYPVKDASSKNNYAFVCASKKGHEDVMTWLVRKFPEVKDHAQRGDTLAFAVSLYREDYCMAKFVDKLVNIPREMIIGWNFLEQMKTKIKNKDQDYYDFRAWMISRWQLD